MLRIVFAARWLVISLAMAGGILGVALAVATTRIVSQGLLLTPGLTISEYKSYEAALSSPLNMAQFLDSLQSESVVSAELKRIVSVPGEFARAVSPVFSLTGKEAKLYDVPSGDASSVVGLRLLIRNLPSAERPAASYLADYVRHTLLRVDLVKSFDETCSKLDGEILQARNYQIESDWELQRLAERIQEMQSLLPLLNRASPSAVPQIVPADPAGYRFMPLNTQIIAASIEVADLKQLKASKLREATSLQLQRQFYCRARPIVDGGKSAPGVLIALAKLRGEIFSEHDMALPVVQQTANTLAAIERTWYAKYLEELRLVTAPDPKGHTVRTVGRLAAGVAGFAFGLGLGVLLALGRSWLSRSSRRA
jgi:hypothetical protein